MFSIVGRRYSAGSSRRFSPFFSDRFERRGLVYVGASIQHKTASDAVFAEYDFTWDAGNRIIEIDSTDGTAEYTYDKTGQLTGADYDYITDELYTYDDNGNRTNAGYITGENNETLSDGVYRYSYDAEGNRTEKFLWTDSNNDGIIDASEKTLIQTYNWDYRNRLESVTNYESGIAKEVINYLYDYLNLMIERTVTDAATSVLQSSEYNLYSNGQVVLEYDTTSSVDVLKSVNLWGANIDELVAVEKMAQNVNDSNVILWTYGDHLNSIRDVLTYDSITQTAAVVNHLIYNAFGILVSSTDGNSNNPTSISPLLKYRYTGKYYDDLTGLQNNINRWYDNTTGKWLSVDPIGFNGRDVNLYRYVYNFSILSSDKSGLISFIEVSPYANVSGKANGTIIFDDADEGRLSIYINNNEKLSFDAIPGKRINFIFDYNWLIELHDVNTIRFVLKHKNGKIEEHRQQYEIKEKPWTPTSIGKFHFILAENAGVGVSDVFLESSYYTIRGIGENDSVFSFVTVMSMWKTFNLTSTYTGNLEAGDYKINVRLSSETYGNVFSNDNLTFSHEKTISGPSERIIRNGNSTRVVNSYTGMYGKWFSEDPAIWKVKSKDKKYTDKFLEYITIEHTPKVETNCGNAVGNQQTFKIPMPGIVKKAH